VNTEETTIRCASCFGLENAQVAQWQKKGGADVVERHTENGKGTKKQNTQKLATKKADGCVALPAKRSL
jgi:hypothetical protein